MGAVLGAISDAVLEALGFDEDFAVIGPFGPDGVATLVFDIEVGFRVTHRWSTDVQPMDSGKERRHASLDAPQQLFSGTAFLEGNLPRQVKAILARYAAAGSVFLLGLPHEQLQLTADASGNTVFVHSSMLAKCDWKNSGQRVALVVRDPDTNQLVFKAGVIQDAGVSSIVLDITPGPYGAEGAAIMPLFPIYPEPQQDFERFKTNVEKWKLSARAAIFDFAPTRAYLELGPLTASAAFDNVIIYARDATAIGNTRWFSLQSGGAGAGTLDDNNGSPFFTFEAGVTTLGDLATALASSSYVIMGGTYNPADVIAAGDSFPLAQLGGAGISGPIGSGATLTTYAGDGISRPVWDRELENPTTVTDAVQANTRIIDHGATPYSLAKVDKPTNGRNILYIGDDHADWQWWKLFTATAKGRQKAFWLPTWADDMTFVSRTLPGGGITLLVISSEDESDLFAWWPQKREHIQVIESDGTITHTKITAAVDNGDGTITLTVGATIGVDVVQISWLELVRFSADDHEVTFGIKNGLFAFPSHATEVDE